MNSAKQSPAGRVWYDKRHGWHYTNHQGDLHGCPAPFTSKDEAASFALEVLRLSDASLHAITSTARQALADGQLR